MTAPLEQHEATPCTAAGCTRPRGAGTQLCDVDARRLGDWLAQLGTEYELLSAVPSMQGREVGTIGGSTLASQRSVGLTHVMALRDPRRGTGRIWADDADDYGLDDTPSVFSTLAGYAEQVRDGRDLMLPVIHVEACLFPCMHRACVLGMGHAVPVALTVATERKLLADHFDWILGQDWAGEFFDTIRALWTLLRSANGHAAATPKVRCREHGCGGTVRWTDGAAVCGACGNTTRGLDVIRKQAEEAA